MCIQIDTEYRIVTMLPVNANNKIIMKLNICINAFWSYAFHRKNAYANLHSGIGPKLDLRPEELAALKSGGKSIDELTGNLTLLFYQYIRVVVLLILTSEVSVLSTISPDFCKKIAERQVGLSSDSDSDGLGHPGSDDEDAPFINHPFKVRPQEPIMMNIRVCDHG